MDTDAEDTDGAEKEFTAGSYNSTEQPMPPKFTKMDKMHRVVAKPAGNMLRLKCPAEGIQHLLLYMCYFLKQTTVSGITQNISSYHLY